MISLSFFRPAHLAALDIQDEQAFSRDPATFRFYEDERRAMTAFDDGKPVACAGLAEAEGRIWAWAVLGCDARRAMLAATRSARRVLECSTGNVATMVRVGFDAGERWVKMLGFEATSEPHRLMPDGRTYAIWERRHG